MFLLINAATIPADNMAYWVRPICILKRSDHSVILVLYYVVCKSLKQIHINLSV